MGRSLGHLPGGLGGRGLIGRYGDGGVGGGKAGRCRRRRAPILSEAEFRALVERSGLRGRAEGGWTMRQRC